MDLEKYHLISMCCLGSNVECTATGTLHGKYCGPVLNPDGSASPSVRVCGKFSKCSKLPEQLIIFSCFFCGNNRNKYVLRNWIN